MSVVVRRIAKADAPLLLDFYNNLSAASKLLFHPLGEVTTIERCAEVIFENEPAREAHYDLVACDGGMIVGWAFLWSLDADAPMFGIAVSEVYHGQGLGARLMDAVLAFADERGYSKITLTVVRDNEKAQRMYERRGFVPGHKFTGEDGLPYLGMTRGILDGHSLP
jgi:ribosomal protein S18 acetylase RimI-like enzyme